MKFKIKIEEMNSEIQDLNQFAESSKEIKEMLLKQKNDVDIKYNNSLMMITQLNDEKSLIQKKNNELEEELKNSSKKFDEFKNQISNEYQKIKNEFELSKKEKDLLKGTLLDFKNYFMKFIGNDGEIIEK
jgi:predicted nuclease with TOPRIM domain